MKTEKRYSFRLTKDDDDIGSVLDALSSKEWSNFIRGALRFYITYKEQQEIIEQKLDSIIVRLDHKSTEGQSVHPSVSQDRAEGEDPVEKILADTLQDILKI